MKVTNDREATQRFVILDSLSAHCMEILTPDKIELIAAEIFEEATSGPASWAFKPGEQVE